VANYCRPKPNRLFLLQQYALAEDIPSSVANSLSRFSPEPETITIRFAGWQDSEFIRRESEFAIGYGYIRQDSEFAIGYGYPKPAFKQEPDTDKDIRNAFLDISRIQTLGKSCTLHNHLFSRCERILIF